MAQTTATSSLTPQSFYQSTLSGSITASDTTIPINSLPTANEGYLVLESTSSTAREIIHYTSKTGSAVVCGAVGDRGLFGTTAQAHSSGALVEDNWVTGYWLDLQSQVATTSATTLQRHLANPTEGQFGNNFVSSGYGLTGASSSLVATLASGIAYVAGSRVLAAVGGHTYQAASDTYVDVNSSGSLTFAGATSGNSGASVPITSNSIRLARVNTHATGINAITQDGQPDKGGNSTYLGNGQIREIDFVTPTQGSNFTTTSASYVDVTAGSFAYTTGANPEKLYLTLTVLSSLSAAANAQITLATVIGGVTTALSPVIYVSGTGVTSQTFSRTYAFTIPANTSSTIKIQAKTDANTLSINQNGADFMPSIRGYGVRRVA